MRNLAISSTLALVLLVMFFGGVMIAAPGVSMVGFCGWTPAMLFLGYSLANAGIRIAIHGSAAPGTKPLSAKAPGTMKASQP